MSTAAIICKGEFPRKEYPRYLISTADYIVCCDGALEKYLRHFSRTPDLVIGDMDSLPRQLRRKYSSLILHVGEQEHNDQTKAVRHILSARPDVGTIHIFGATGLREDHTVGNLSLLMEYRRMFPGTEVSIDIISDRSTAFAITDSIDLHVGEGRRFSIFSPDNSLTIKSSGLQWPTDEVIWDNWWKGTLNRATADVVSLVFSHPSIALVILD